MEVTCRTIQGRFLLKPTRELKSLLIGVLARAQKLYPVKIHAFVFMSNHYHLLLSVEDAHRLSRFMNYLNSNLAREAGRLSGWTERFWGRRYQAIVISQEEAAQIGRLRYLLSHGCKEGLVARPQDWPGAHCAGALKGDQWITGIWVDRTRQYAARMRGEKIHRLKYATRERVRLDFLPCWSPLSRMAYHTRVRELIAEIERETEALHVREGTRPLGIATVQAQHPHDRPQALKKKFAPAFHAATRTARQELAEAYRWFAAAYRTAAERLGEGRISLGFPAGSFPPGLPFVGRDGDFEPG